MDQAGFALTRRSTDINHKLTDDIPLDILFTISYCDYFLSEEDYVSIFDGIL